MVAKTTSDAGRILKGLPSQDARLSLSWPGRGPGTRLPDVALAARMHVSCHHSEPVIPRKGIRGADMEHAQASSPEIKRSGSMTAGIRAESGYKGHWMFLTWDTGFLSEMVPQATRNGHARLPVSLYAVTLPCSTGRAPRR